MQNETHAENHRASSDVDRWVAKAARTYSSDRERSGYLTDTAVLPWMLGDALLVRVSSPENGAHSDTLFCTLQRWSLLRAADELTPRRERHAVNAVAKTVCVAMDVRAAVLRPRRKRRRVFWPNVQRLTQAAAFVTTVGLAALTLWVSL